LTHFDEFSQNHTLRKKAESQGYKIDLVLNGSTIVNLNNETNSYEAAIITDFLRHSLIEKGDDLTFETLMAHESKIKTLKKAHELGYRNYLYYVGPLTQKLINLVF
jgi:predicted ABC-type ATPase